MSEIISCSFFCSFTCGIIQHLLENNQEEKLKELGMEIGFRWLEFKQIRRDVSLIANLQKLTFSILPEIYTSKRTIERGEEKGTFLLTELTPLISKFVSVPPEYEGFSVDLLMGGFIEAILKGFGYNSSIETINVSISNTTVYYIKINED